MFALLMQLCLNSRQPALGWKVGARAGAYPQCHAVEPRTEITVLTDVSEWVPPFRLKGWIEQEIGNLDWDSPQTSGSLRRPLDHQPKMLLSLLSFAYARGVFGHEEIAARCDSDAMFRVICEGKVPVVQDLSNFRRRNRLLLERILAGVFLQAVRDKFELDAAWLSPELAQDLSDQATHRLNLARHMNNGE
jgi:hypothetical protein